MSVRGRHTIRVSARASFRVLDKLRLRAKFGLGFVIQTSTLALKVMLILIRMGSLIVTIGGYYTHTSGDFLHV